ncbi:hypothetical protein VC83_06079 [Pseudogymnoascus destructans]|uniref:DDE-1 domain-containing protein n=1 Tax=Pseudogymnoascus destructans TaxID=655981 RepID=A0A177AB18_9PEZI|nr:uncharacterized protein VC83_06079 [Pseudogymnoascus destructans]OAF58950.1 hypothetical protein VC83_06079 [Pseudogymnoascus destructans]
MILSVYRKILQQQPHLIYIWDDLLPHVVNIINTWKVSVYVGIRLAKLDELRDMAMQIRLRRQLKQAKETAQEFAAKNHHIQELAMNFSFEDGVPAGFISIEGLGSLEGQVGHGRRREEEAEEAEEDEEEEENWGGAKGPYIIVE